MAKMHTARQSIGRFLAAGLLATHLLVVSMAMAPALHHWLHGDSDKPDHQCAVTAMIDGQLDRPDVACLNIGQPRMLVAICEPASHSRPMPAFPLSLPAGRAPPLA
ncbi:MAG: hypothetical protein ACREKL_02710 [Chthoniobacterales bacterium]